jgi:exopolysaccharide production protein ExoQ
MPRVALLMCIMFIIWLYVRDRKLRPMASWALWIPLLWVMIVGTRGSSYWFSLEVDRSLSSAAYLEGSPADRNIYLSLIIAGAVILWRRHLEWGRVFSSNRWLVAFVFYCGLSIVWSDYPLSSFKGWIKDLGHMVMVLIIFTENDPAQAVKAVFYRYLYLAVLLSAVLIMYFPELSSYYAVAEAKTVYCGVTTNKNELGEILVICGLFLVRDFIEKQAAAGAKTNKVDLLVRTALLVTVIWLLKVTESSTADACLALGSVILITMRFPPVRNQVRHLGMYSLALVSLVVFVNIPAVLKAIVETLGRDMTFTGRTEIWEGLLSEPVNPILGTGFHSFWLGPGVMERYGNINQAHNGYLETYLNNGLAGLFLLMAVIISVGIKMKKELLHDSSFGTLLFSFFVVSLIYNLTEAMFNRLSLVWFIFLLATVDYTLSPKPVSEHAAERATPLVPRGRVLRVQGTVRYLNGRCQGK